MSRQQFVIPTKATDRLGRSVAAWRDLRFTTQLRDYRDKEKAGPSTALILSLRSWIKLRSG